MIKPLSTLRSRYALRRVVVLTQQLRARVKRAVAANDNTHT
jgi:hypothetical protein